MYDWRLERYKKKSDPEIKFFNPVCEGLMWFQTDDTKGLLSIEAIRERVREMEDEAYIRGLKAGLKEARERRKAKNK